MTSSNSKLGFMSSLHYLDYQQMHGKPHGDKRLLNRRFSFSKNLHSKDLLSHYGCVNAVEFSDDGEWLVSGGDDKRVLIWNVNKNLSSFSPPKSMKGEHNSNIFALGISKNHCKLYSAGNDEQVISHDVVTGETLDVFLHTEAVYGLSVDPLNESIFASACDDGRVQIWDTRASASNDPFTLAACSVAFHAVMYNPCEPKFLATANAKDGVCLWDIRKPKEHLMKYGSSLLSLSAMSVRFNSVGSHLLALRRRFPPVLYETTSNKPCAEFDHQEYYNSCTMKSCCFAGDKDQYVLSGSDDFKLYVWEIPEGSSFSKGTCIKKAHFILRGHRSIVNQVRYNSAYGVIASSGVEKIIKLWSPFLLTNREDCQEYVSPSDALRRVYSHEEYINLVLESGHHMTHDYSHHSVQEDPRMMAFFDSLVQRDIEGWTTDSSNATEKMNSYWGVVQSSDSLSSSTSDDDTTNTSIHLYEVDNHDNHSSAKIPMSLQHRLLANNSSDDPQSESRETLDPNLDKISILIAKKRKEQMLRTKHLTHHKKNGKTLLKTNAEQNEDNAGPSTMWNMLCPQKRSFSVKNDKRKLLWKRRAKLNKDPSLEGNSSDSDMNSDKDVVDKKDSINNQFSMDKDFSKPSTSSFVEIECVSTNGIGQKSKSTCNDNLKISTDNDLSKDDDEGVTNFVPVFTSKIVKRNNRNYRKKSAEDNDQD